MCFETVIGGPVRRGRLWGQVCSRVFPASELHTYTVLYHFDRGVDLNEEKDGFVLSANNLSCTLCIEGPGSAETQVTHDDKLAAIARERPLPCRGPG